VTFDERFIEFWHRTWSKWRLGFDSDLENFADVSFDEFLKSARIDNINLLSMPQSFVVLIWLLEMKQQVLPIYLLLLLQ
jgi:hypothetical protein